MQVEVQVATGNGSAELMAFPLQGDLPQVGDQFVVSKDNGSKAAFQVATRTWVVEENPEGGGVKVKLVVLVWQMMMSEAKPEEESSEE
jgi:hypothetical protein